MYWSLEGDLSITKAKRRYNACNTTVWDELINDGIIKVSGDQISITFLDEQLNERRSLSEQNAKNVSKRWKKPINDTVVLPSNNDGKLSVYNKEEKREEKKREEENDVFVSGQTAFEEIQSDELMVESLVRSVHQLGFRAITPVEVMKAVRFFLTKEAAKPEFKRRPRDAIKSHLVNWIAQNASKIQSYG